jgi:hypothetical protein
MRLGRPVLEQAPASKGASGMKRGARWLPKLRASRSYLCGAKRQASHVLLQGFGIAAEMLRGLARLARSGEDRPLIIPQERYPVLDIARVPQLTFDIQMSAEECGAELSYQLLGRIGSGAEAIRQIPIEPGLVPAPMTCLMKCRSTRSAA